MKIPQDVKKLERHFEKWRPPKDKQSGKGKQHCGYYGQIDTAHTRKARTVQCIGKKCMKCQKVKHFSSVCKSKGPHNSKTGIDQKHDHKPPENSRHKRRVKRTSEEEDDDNSTSYHASSDDEFNSQFCQAVRQLKQVKKIKTDGEDRTVSVKTEDADVRAEPNGSGAEVNFMDKHQFKALKNRSSVKLTVQPSRVKLRTLQSELLVKGEFTATVRNQTCGAVARFVVTRGRITSPPLISKNTLKSWTCYRSEKMANDQ